MRGRGSWLMANAATTVAAPLSTAAEWNLWIAALVVALLGLVALIDYRPWHAWTATLLGMWLVASPWVFGFSAATLIAWTVVGAGALVILFSLGSLVLSTDERRYA